MTGFINFLEYNKCGSCRWKTRCAGRFWDAWNRARDMSTFTRTYRRVCRRALYDRLDNDVERHNAAIYMESGASITERLVMSMEDAIPRVVIGARVAGSFVKSNPLVSHAIILLLGLLIGGLL